MSQIKVNLRSSWKIFDRQHIASKRSNSVCSWGRHDFEKSLDLACSWGRHDFSKSLITAEISSKSAKSIPVRKQMVFHSWEEEFISPKINEVVCWLLKHGLDWRDAPLTTPITEDRPLPLVEFWEWSFDVVWHPFAAQSENFLSEESLDNLKEIDDVQGRVELVDMQLH